MFYRRFIAKISKEAQDKRRKLSDSQIITTALISTKYFYGNQAATCLYMQAHHGFQMPDKSSFNRGLHRLSDLIVLLFTKLAEVLKVLNLESVYIIDYSPIAICKNIRIGRCKLLKQEDFRGYNASKKEFFYGFKVQMITTGQGLPVSFLVVPVSIHDNKALQYMEIELPENSHLYADAAYLNKYMKDILLDILQVKFKVTTKKNTLERNNWAQELEIKHFRSPIENTFAQINAKLPKKIRATTIKGFLLKILILIFMFTLDKLSV